MEREVICSRSKSKTTALVSGILVGVKGFQHSGNVHIQPLISYIRKLRPKKQQYDGSKVWAVPGKAGMLVVVTSSRTKPDVLS